MLGVCLEIGGHQQVGIKHWLICCSLEVPFDYSDPPSSAASVWIKGVSKWINGIVSALHLLSLQEVFFAVEGNNPNTQGWTSVCCIYHAFHYYKNWKTAWYHSILGVGAQDV
jgi:hypothetical protein